MREGRKVSLYPPCRVADIQSVRGNGKERETNEHREQSEKLISGEPISIHYFFLGQCI